MWTNHSLLFNASAGCWNMSCHLFRHHPGADSVRVRPEQHTLISVFKLNSCMLFQFKHLRAREHELARPMRRFVWALIRSAQTHPNIKLSLKYCVWMDKFTQKLSKCPSWQVSYSRHSRLNVQYQCILLKWQHFLNINQTATTRTSLTALDWMAFVTLIKINISFIQSNMQCYFTFDYFIKFLYLKTWSLFILFVSLLYCIYLCCW